MILTVLLLSTLLNAPMVTAAEPAPLQAARSQFDSGNYTVAVGMLMAATQQNPKDASLHYWLARSYYEIRDYEKAIKFAETVVQLDP